MGTTIQRGIRSVRRGARRIRGVALSPVRAGVAKLASRRAGLDAPRALVLTSRAFRAGKSIPKRHAAHGANRSPPLKWTGVPKRARSLVVICEDPDAPERKPFVHWLLWDLAPARGKLRGGLKPKRRPPHAGGAVQGRNGNGTRGYTGPLPPPGHGTHRYHFQLFALDRKLKLEPRASRRDVVKAMRGHVVAFGQLVGTYRR